MCYFKQSEISKSLLFPLCKRGTEGDSVWCEIGTAYFEGNSNRTYELWVNGVKKHILTVRPNIAYDFDVLIPKALYQHTHHISLSIKNPNNTGVSLAGLGVYRKIDAKSGGPQSYGTVEFNNSSELTITPNPFKESTVIRFSMANSCLISVRIYDAIGRLVKRFDGLIMQSCKQITWDGCDDTGKLMPSGIYFLELKFINKTITAQMVLLK